MIETASQQDLSSLRGKIAALHQFFKNNGDTETADKAKQLGKKLFNQEYAIAFCGHFSAGKSSMINKIIGENLLPSSPIPTSANLVKIKSGDEYAKVYFKEGTPRLYPAPYNYEKVKSYCKDGDAIESIEISHKTNKLPTNACIMDTPGIDSTDDAHRVATESALHLADIIFYVMDYNHVQSELNFLFTKELTEAGKELYLVINQIDKHQEEELSFNDFKNSVKDSFAAWGVNPTEIFYTSLKEEKHEHNRFSQLQQFIQSKLAQRESLLPVSISHSLAKLTEEHNKFLVEKDRGKLKDYEEQLSSLSQEEQQQLPKRVEKIDGELQELFSKVDEKEIDFENGINKILKNAYLMPFETRELAETYLQSTQSDFKVGLFFSKQKTEQERNERLERFLADFQDKVTSQLSWHLKEFIGNALKTEEVNDPNLHSRVQALTVTITKEMLASAVKDGARLSGDYVLNYTSDVADIAKKAARQEVMKLKETFIEIIKKSNEGTIDDLQKNRNHLSNLLDAWLKKQEILDNHTVLLMQMEKLISGQFEQDFVENIFKEITEEKEKLEIINELEEDLEIKKENELATNQIETQVTNETRKEDSNKLEKVVRKLQYSARELHQLPGFKKISSLLSDKADRLQRQGFTVALFGAFSAGKSSFANSLIGEKLLPVSPNPTTAAINKIMPIDEEHSHGLVKVQLKKADVLFEEINRSLAVFEFQAKDFDEALAHIEKIIGEITSFDAHEKTHISFLTAFHKGFDSYRNQLGETIETDIDEFREYVANEEKSCLVELIEVYYDCKLTRKGITLVDTPGADSINARHTGVAFDYIKNSDAILFVTYYNHAFSKADREFLIQLGRVKDTFELDKMFFIVNAVDLANSDEEKNEVLNYVKDQLIKYGIRMPSLFPVSSLLAIKEKLEQTKEYKSGINFFEEKFYSFITHDLTDITINSALVEWERAIEQLRSFIHSANTDNEKKQEKLVALQSEHGQIESKLNNQPLEILVQRLNQEIEELTYYIKQRVFLRFSDFFKEAFNPSVLKDDGRNLRKAIQHALDDFLEDFGFDFAQELRATTLRVESFIGKLMDDTHKTIQNDLSKLNPELSFSQHQLSKMDGLEFQNAFFELDRDMFKKVLSLFKNPKSFFENNEKRYLQDALQEVLQTPTDEYLENEKVRLISYYNVELGKAFDLLNTRFKEEATEYYEGLYATLSNEIPVQQLIDLEKELIRHGEND